MRFWLVKFWHFIEKHENRVELVTLYYYARSEWGETVEALQRYQVCGFSLIENLTRTKNVTFYAYTHSNTNYVSTKNGRRQFS